MKALRLPLALLFCVGALTFAYFYITHSPWYGRPATHNTGPPKAPPGAGPTPEQLKIWAASIKKTPEHPSHKQTAPNASKKGGE